MNTRIICSVGSPCVYNKEKLKAIKVEIRRKNCWDSDGSYVLLKRNLRNFEELKVHVRNDNVNTFTKPLMEQIFVVVEKNVASLQNGKEKTEAKKCVVSRAYEMREGNEENQHYMKSFRGYNFLERDNLHHENYIPSNKLNKRSHLEENESTSTGNQEGSFKRSKSTHFNRSFGSPWKDRKLLHRAGNHSLPPYKSEKHYFSFYKDGRCLKCSHCKEGHDKYHADSACSTTIFKIY